MILNCWIIDDEPLALDLLESYIRKTPFLQITGRFSNAIQAMKIMNSEEQTVHLIFLDIQMPDLNGMDFARVLNSETRIIFTTAFSEYALEGYKVSALDYLLKPFSYSDFLLAAQKAFDWFKMKNASLETAENESSGFFVRSEYKWVQILFDKILYVEGLKDYVKIFCENEPKPILTLMSMKSVEEALPAKQFIRVHRSFIVNRNMIAKVEKNRITIATRNIPIGETYRKSFKVLIESK